MKKQTESKAKGGLGAISPVWIALGTLVLIAVVVGLWWMGTYNTLVAKDEGVKGQWGNVQTVYQRRADLIPNLVNVASAYMKNERELFEEFAKARQSFSQAGTPQDQVKAANALESTIAKFLVVSENYPELKANENFLELQSQLEGTENRIAVERSRYNDAVKDYSAYKRSFPASLIGSGFPAYEYFEAKAGSEDAPKVTFP